MPNQPTHNRKLSLRADKIESFKFFAYSLNVPESVYRQRVERDEGADHDLSRLGPEQNTHEAEKRKLIKYRAFHSTVEFE